MSSKERSLLQVFSLVLPVCVLCTALNPACMPREHHLKFCNASLSGFGGQIPSLAFLKTHKTGSSTVASICNRIVDCHGLKKAIPRGYVHLKLKSGTSAHLYDAICNHLNFNLHEDVLALMLANVNKPSFLFTILRNPETQIVSAWNYFNDTQDWGAFAQRLKEKRAVHPVPFHSQIFKRYVNPQAGDLGWYTFSGGDLTQDRNKTKILEFIAHLQRALDQVLVVERLAEGLVLLQRQTNLTLALPELVPKSMKTNDHNIHPSQDQYQWVLDMQLPDRMLHAHFLAEHDRLWREEAARNHLARTELEQLACLTRRVNEDDHLPRQWKMDSKAYTRYLEKKYKKAAQQSTP